MKARLIHLTIGLSLALCPAAFSEESASEVKVAGYHLKRQSTFQAAQSVRAPFWPIGWAPTAKGPAHIEAAAPEFTLKPEQFSVTSILLGSQSLAVINGRTYGEGEFLRNVRAVKPAEGAPASAPALPVGMKIRVNRIADGQVILQAGVQSVAVPLKRPQLSEKKSGDEDLLSQAANER